MDGIVGLGHFCETHGPCVILSTQRCEQEPQQFPHSLKVPVCEACQSIDLRQAMVCKNNGTCFVTTRTPLQQHLAFLMRQAVVRSLSCEETSKQDDSLYFGDNKRGHIISHMFTVQDSLARGFQRKYCILILTKDKIHLLNCWPFLTKEIRSISKELQKLALTVNNVEQLHKSQRAVRQAQAAPVCTGRSLGQLTGQPEIFAQIHLWFAWLLSSETVVEKPFKPPEIPADCPGLGLRQLYQSMKQEVFQKLCYCYLTGIRVNSENQNILAQLQQLLPRDFSLPKTGEICELYATDGTLAINWNRTLPRRLPTLLASIEAALKNPNLPDAALGPHLTSVVMQWRNIACAVGWAPDSNNVELLRSLGVQKHDMPLLSYWVTQCKK